MTAFAASIATMAIVVIIGLMLDTWAGTPQVLRSWESRECVQVRPPDAGTCAALPERYEVVWVR